MSQTDASGNNFNELMSPDQIKRQNLLKALEFGGEEGLDILQAGLSYGLSFSEIIKMITVDEEARAAYAKGVTKTQLKYINNMKLEESDPESKNSYNARKWLLEHYAKNHEAISRFTPAPILPSTIDGSTMQSLTIKDMSILEDFNRRMAAEEENIDADVEQINESTN